MSAQGESKAPVVRLSQAQRQLLELIQRYSFCEIENLEVRGGEPVFDPAPRITQEIKIGADDGRRPEKLLEHINRLGDGRIAVIEVRHRLPFRLVVERSVLGELA